MSTARSKTTIIIGDSRKMKEITDESVHLIHPPLRLRGGKGELRGCVIAVND